jgi:hypothetical protein
MGGCRIVFFFYHTGSMRLTGNSVTLYPAGGRERLENSCNPSRNYDRPRSPEFLVPETFSVEIHQDEYGHQSLWRSSEHGVLTYSRP